MIHQAKMPKPESTKIEYIKFGLIVISIFILSAGLAYWQNDLNIRGWMRWFMGVFFIVFAAFKIVGYKMFVEMFPSYDLIAMRSKAYGYLYPFIELGLGVSYVFNILPLGRDIVTLIIMSMSAFGVARTLRLHRGIQCACLGNVIKLPLSTTSLVEDIGMAVMALVMLLLRLIWPAM